MAKGNYTAEERRIRQVGARVEGGDNAEDYDTGRVTAVDGDDVTVAWSNGTRTTQPTSVLRPEGSNPHR